MPPISISLYPFLYLKLYGLVQTATTVAGDLCKNKDGMFDYPNLLTVADIRIKDPQGMIFPKKGKRVKLTVSQAVALHTTLRVASNTPGNEVVLQLLGIVDHALTNYNTHFGYRS